MTACTREIILDSLKPVYLGGIYIQKERVGIVYSLVWTIDAVEVEHRADSAEIADTKETRAGKISNIHVCSEKLRFWLKIRPKLSTGELAVNL